MPIFNKNNKKNKVSVYLAEKIVHSLNLQLESVDLNFTVRFYKDDQKLIDIMDSTTIPTGNESKYYEELLKKYKIDYFISANYNYDDYNNNFIIEKLTLYSNYMIPGTKRKQISAQNASVVNDPGPAPIYRSAIVPGWGQIYKEQKAKGYTLLVSEVLFVAGAFVAQNLYDYNYNKAIKSRKNPATYIFYLDKSDAWATMRNMALVGAGAVYIYSFVDAIASKRKLKNSYSLLNNKRIHVLPLYTGQSYLLSLNINLN